MKKLEYAEGTNPQIFNRCLSKEEIKERYEFEMKMDKKYVQTNN